MSSDPAVNVLPLFVTVMGAYSMVIDGRRFWSKEEIRDGSMDRHHLTESMWLEVWWDARNVDDTALRG